MKNTLFQTRWLLLFIANVAGVCSCARLETANVLARVLAVEGEVDVVRRDETEPKPIVVDQKLAPRDTIRARPGARLTVSLLPGITMVVLGDSELTLGKLQIRKSGEAVDEPMRERRAEVHLGRGSVCGAIADLEGESESLLTVTTTAATFDAESGAVFVVRSDGSRSHVVCAHEEISWRQGDDDESSGTVEQGEAQEFTGRSGVATAAAEVQAGSPEEEEVAIALDAQKHAVQLEGRILNQIPAVAAQ